MTHVLALLKVVYAFLWHHPWVCDVVFGVILGATLFKELLKTRSAWTSRASVKSFFYATTVQTGNLYFAFAFSLLAIGFVLRPSHLISNVIAALIGLTWVAIFHAFVIGLLHDQVYETIRQKAVADLTRAETQVLKDTQPVIEKSVQEAIFN